MDKYSKQEAEKTLLFRRHSASESDHDKFIVLSSSRYLIV